MLRYPTFSANSTACWVTCPGGDWYTPRPRRGIMTPLFSLANGSTIACIKRHGLLGSHFNLNPTSIRESLGSSAMLCDPVYFPRLARTLPFLHRETRSLRPPLPGRSLGCLACILGESQDSGTV